MTKGPPSRTMRLRWLSLINGKIEKRKEVVRDAEAATAGAVAEVASLAAQFASERKAPTLQVPPQAGADAPPPPGFVAVAFAEEKWAEREAAFAKQFAQLQALVDAHSEHATTPGTTSVEAEDSSSADFEDDEAWGKVEKGKRKALLRKEREILATKVRHSLGKVSTHVSPFKKS